MSNCVKQAEYPYSPHVAPMLLDQGIQAGQDFRLEKASFYHQGHFFGLEGQPWVEVLHLGCVSAVSGHFGHKTAGRLLTKSFWWPKMEVDIKTYGAFFEICSHAKTCSYAKT